VDQVTDSSKQKNKSEKSTLPQDRVTLTTASAKKLDQWINQINEKHMGVITVTRSDLVNSFLGGQSEVLSKEQIEKIKAAHFDEVRFAQWALKQIKESKQKGEPLTLKDIVAMSKLVDLETPKRAKPAKSVGSSEPGSQLEENNPKKLNSSDPGKPNL